MGFNLIFIFLVKELWLLSKFLGKRKVFGGMIKYILVIWSFWCCRGRVFLLELNIEESFWMYRVFVFCLEIRELFVYLFSAVSCKNVEFLLE